MFTDADLESSYKIFKHIQPKISESMVLYKTPDESNFGQVIKYLVKNKIIAIWLDVKVVNPHKLKILFSRHKEVDQDFFIQQINDFYRIGWKTRK